MIHFRNRQLIHDLPIATETSSHLPKSLDTNLVCMFKVLFVRFSKLQNLLKESSSSCPALVERVKSSIESKISGMEPTYSKYANFPSCSAR